MDVSAELDAPVPPSVLFAAVDELGCYPAWLDIVTRAQPVDAGPGDRGPAWSVDLRARLGPLARSKRLRMVRTVHEANALVRFERHELDGRRHSPWILTAEVGETPGGSHLTMALHYGGNLLVPVVECLLADAVARSTPRLLAHVTG